ncbi:hypothetical protein DAPPUDRAFT_113606 [Daphnia pulex]|uniref:Uncharacterized protein n=1 Tax=Daphnia pulex TaxID=6669 RepID=E9HFH0_DAPPU|nr:hypothetical protein DAPPUDRAFT_113606 [Daphnia pulex]|eukprot:EFX69532.1 hypothetical protein DAPPUDRAFT_113606 [Daphnia pulex]
MAVAMAITKQPDFSVTGNNTTHNSDESSRLINDVPLCQDSRVGDVDYFRLLGEKFSVKSSALRPNTYFHITVVCDTNNQPPQSLQVRPSERRKEVAKQHRQIQDLPAHPQKELVECDNIMRHNANLVEAYKATARAAAKKRFLMFGEIDLLQDEARFERKRQVLLSKSRRMEEGTPVQCNLINPLASIRAAGQSTSGPKPTTRQELEKVAYSKDLQLPRAQQQPMAPAGISPLLKLANELSKVLTSNTVFSIVEDYPGNLNVPRPRTRQCKGSSKGNEKHVFSAKCGWSLSGNLVQQQTPEDKKKCNLISNQEYSKKYEEWTKDIAKLSNEFKSPVTSTVTVSQCNPDVAESKSITEASVTETSDDGNDCHTCVDENSRSCGISVLGVISGEEPDESVDTAPVSGESTPPVVYVPDDPAVVSESGNGYSSVSNMSVTAFLYCLNSKSVVAKLLP